LRNDHRVRRGARRDVSPRTTSTSSRARRSSSCPRASLAWSAPVRRRPGRADVLPRCVGSSLTSVPTFRYLVQAGEAFPPARKGCLDQQLATGRAAWANYWDYTTALEEAVGPPPSVTGRRCRPRLHLTAVVKSCGNDLQRRRLGERLGAEIQSNNIRCALAQAPTPDAVDQRLQLPAGSSAGAPPFVSVINLWFYDSPAGRRTPTCR